MSHLFKQLLIAGIALIAGQSTLATQDSKVNWQDGIAQMITALEVAQGEIGRDDLQIDEPLLANLLFSIGIHPANNQAVAEEISTAPLPPMPAIKSKKHRSRHRANKARALDEQSGAQSVKTPQDPSSIPFVDAMNEIQSEHREVLERYRTQDDLRRNLGNTLHPLLHLFPQISVTSARYLFSLSLTVLYYDPLHSSVFAITNKEQFATLPSSTIFVPLLFEASSDIQYFEQLNPHFSQHQEQNLEEKHGTGNREQGSATKLCLVIPIDSLAFRLQALARFAGILGQANQLISSLANTSICKKKKLSISKDADFWLTWSQLNSLHPNLSTAFTMYLILKEMKEEYKINSSTKVYRHTKIDKFRVLNEHYSNLFFALATVWLQPYAQLFAFIQKLPFDENLVDLPFGKLAQFIEKYGRNFDRKEHEKTRRALHAQKHKRESEKTQVRRERAMPPAGPAHANRSTQQESHLPDLLTDEAIAEAEARRQRKEEKERRRALAADKEEAEEPEEPTQRAVQWKELTKKQRRAQSHRKKERAQAIVRNYKEKEEEPEKEVEHKQSQERILALWPTESQEFVRYMNAQEITNSPVYQAFISPFDKRFSITHEEINLFFTALSNQLRHFLNQETDYSAQAIEEFVQAFLKYALATEHPFHGDSHGQHLPGNYVAHRRGALIIFGIMSEELFNHVGKDCREYAHKYLLALMHK